jgi:type IV pilus assembly protein PilB
MHSPKLRPRPLLGDLLVETGSVDRATIERAEEEAVAGGRLLGEQLLAMGAVTETDLFRALAGQRGLPFALASQLLGHLDLDVVARAPRAFLEHNEIAVVTVEGDTLVVAVTNPDAPIDDLFHVYGCRAARVYVVTPTDYRRLWAAIDLRRTSHAPPEASDAAVPTPDLLHGNASLDARYVSLLETLLLDAIGERSSDIHLERYGERVRVRLRVDGRLRDLERYQLRPDELVGVVNVIKIRAGLDIAERRLPQGGRSSVRVGSHAYDLRVQTQPSLHGEHVVLRLLPQQSRLLTIEELGFPAPLAQQYRRLVDSPAGLILVVGPTGSGKTTTLYAGLQLIAEDPSRKAITVEDPIEYSLPDVQQTQVRPEIGFSFAQAMRSFVRQDPDVILVGEIRDGETALEAIRASQTGHLVLSTLHCNDTTDAVQRLIDLGMHPNSISSELLAVIAQRLARRICRHCRVETPANPTILAELFPDGAPEGFRCYRGTGCDRCAGQGTFGRVAVIELLRTEPRVRLAIAHRVSVDELRQIALGAGLQTMRDTALALVTAGDIALDELPRILAEERMAACG